MMSEREDIAAKRSACLATVSALREALSVLDTIPQSLASRINTPARCPSSAPPSPCCQVDSGNLTVAEGASVSAPRPRALRVQQT